MHVCVAFSVIIYHVHCQPMPLHFRASVAAPAASVCASHIWQLHSSHRAKPPIFRKIWKTEVDTYLCSKDISKIKDSSIYPLKLYYQLYWYIDVSFQYFSIHTLRVFFKKSQSIMWFLATWIGKYSCDLGNGLKIYFYCATDGILGRVYDARTEISVGLRSTRYLLFGKLDA